MTCAVNNGALLAHQSPRLECLRLWNPKILPIEDFALGNRRVLRRIAAKYVGLATLDYYIFEAMLLEQVTESM